MQPVTGFHVSSVHSIVEDMLQFPSITPHRVSICVLHDFLLNVKIGVVHQFEMDIKTATPDDKPCVLAVTLWAAAQVGGRAAHGVEPPDSSHDRASFQFHPIHHHEHSVLEQKHQQGARLPRLIAVAFSCWCLDTDNDAYYELLY